jgi:VWFA-related protein
MKSVPIFLALAALLSDQPRDVGLKEKVEVRLVLVDFCVVDDDDRTVPGLTQADFELRVDGKPTEIETLDHACAAGAVEEPQSTRKNEPAVPISADRTRRIVLVLDYDHMEDVAQTFDRVYEMLEQRVAAGYEHMIVSMGAELRIESPFTADVGQLSWTLRRMRNDRDLYARDLSSLTEERFFTRMKALLDLLGRWDGRKAVVLFSGPVPPDGFFRDPQFAALTGLAAESRVAIYPVDTRGLGSGSSASEPILSRLAVSTGGRRTVNTNDITLGYARAQRDLACTYTISFHDPSEKADDQHQLSLRLRTGERGRRIIYPQLYVRRSPKERKKTVTETAALAPELFESKSLATQLFVLEAQKLDVWRTVVATELRLGDSVTLPAEQRWKLEGYLRRPNGTVVRRFEEQLTVPATDPATHVTPPVTLYHALDVPPGEYVLSGVVSGPDLPEPLSATRPVSLAPMPSDGSFVLGPIVGHKVGESRAGFEPLIDAVTQRGQSLDARSAFCTTRLDDPPAPPRLVRWISDTDQRYEDVVAPLRSSGGVRCTSVVDPLATDLAPGTYRLRVRAEWGSFRSEDRESGFVVHE